MPHNVILHPAILAHAEALFRNFATLTLGDQIILTALIQAMATARNNLPLPERLVGMLRVIGGATDHAPRAELDRAKYEVYDTLQRVAARDRVERGEASEVVTYEAWFRDIS